MGSRGSRHRHPPPQPHRPPPPPPPKQLPGPAVKPPVPVHLPPPPPTPGPVVAPDYLCREGDYRGKAMPKAYAIQLVANPKMCWHWIDGTDEIEVSDECNINDPAYQFKFDTSMRIQSVKHNNKCLDLSSSKYKTGDTVKGGTCGDRPTEKFLGNMNKYLKIFKGCEQGTNKHIKGYASGYGRFHVLNELTKCVGIEGSSGEFTGKHPLALDECSVDLKDQDWQIVPVKQLEPYRAIVDEENLISSQDSPVESGDVDVGFGDDHESGHLADDHESGHIAPAHLA